MSNAADDDDLILRMLCGEAEALREMLRRHLEPIKSSLQHRYRNMFDPAAVDEAISRAAMKIWGRPDKFDASLGNLASWFYQLSEWALLDVNRRERRHRRKHPLIVDGFDIPTACDDAADPLPAKGQRQELEDLQFVIEHKLKGNQQAIILADMLADGTADAASLAERLGTTKNSIYVSRTKAHDNIEKFMKERAQQRERLRGKR